MPRFPDTFDAVRYPPFVLAQLAGQVVAQIGVARMLQQDHRLAGLAALHGDLGNPGLVFYANERRHLP
ncbi:hypothetical protein D3C72_2083790 [compost metagenome]